MPLKRPPRRSNRGKKKQHLTRTSTISCKSPAAHQPDSSDGRQRIQHTNAAYFGYAMSADTLYLPASEARGNIWLAEPVENE